MTHNSVINGALFEKTLDFILGIEYNSWCVKSNNLTISRCGSIWGRFRAPPVADAARNKEWRNKEYCEVNNERGDYIATGRAPRSGKRSSDGSTKTQKPLQALIHLGLYHFRNFEKHLKKTK